ncbi:MAG: hypothetical protein JRI68_14855 [Deltaproteobacteria bacterium]|nr:hypothetical protein [Deltaproteobacteria bacterium]
MGNRAKHRSGSSSRPAPARGIATALGLVAWLAAGSSAADGGASTAEIEVSDLEPSPLKRQILDVQKQVRAGDLSPDLVREPLEEAVQAGERARGARAAGDKWHGGLLTKLGEQWASCAAAVVRAAEAEGKARADAKQLRELTTKLERAEALLDEQQARLGRLKAEVAKAEKKAAEAAQTAADGEAKRINRAGKRAGGKPKPGGGAR